MKLQDLPQQITRAGIFLFAATIAVSHVPAQFGIGFAVLGWLLEGILHKRWQWKWNWFFVPLGAYLVWNIISSALSPRPAHSLYAIVDNEWPMFIMLMMFWTVRDSRFLSRVMTAFFVSSSVAMSYAIIQSFVGVEYYRQLHLDPMGSFYRAVGFYGFYLTFAAFAMAVFFLSASFLLEAEGRRTWTKFVLPVLSFSAVVLTFARSIWLSFIGAIPLLGFIRAKKRDWILVIALFAAFIASLVWVPTLRLRAESIFDLQANETRLNLWRTSLRISSDFRFVGIGEDNFDYYFERYKVPGYYDTTAHPHNDYLNVLINAGVPGLIFFLSMWGMVLRTGVITWKKGKNGLARGIALGGTLAVAGLLVGALFQDYYGTFVNCLEWWFVVGLLLAATNIVGEEEGRQDSGIVGSQIRM